MILHCELFFDQGESRHEIRHCRTYRKYALPDGRTALLYSIYEAVSNAIHAIEERFGKAEFGSRGAINIMIDQREDKTLNFIAVSDNGIGLTPTHLAAFETCDTRQKYALGGKGVGRLIWTKVFDRIEVESVYEVGLDRCEKVHFLFDPTTDPSLQQLKVGHGDLKDVGTRILLASIKGGQNAGISRATLARHICHHFFPYFIADGMPKLGLMFGRREIDVQEFIATKVEKVNEEEVIVDTSIGAIKIAHVYVDKSISQELSNTILLTAQRRVVRSVEIEKKFALKGLSNGKAYVCVVTSDFLDRKVDQERTGFKALDHEIEDITSCALSAAEEFLTEHIKSVRVEQTTNVIRILEEHPQLAISVSNVEEYVNSLSPSMSEEDIGKTLFTLLYRHERRIKSEINSINNSTSENVEPEKFHGVIDGLVQKVSDDAKRRLAEYTIKRHQIIQIARSLLRYSNTSKKTYAMEKSLHELICPMGRMLSNKHYDEHNLWLVDDLLSYYSFFASDKSMAAYGVDGEKKEPDLIFLNPLGFRREGTNDPVVIVEFKRPGDEHLSSDPVDQVLDYIERLRSKTIRSVDGEVVSDINDHTPFECVVICDLTAGARKKFERSVAQTPTPDGQGYYGFSPNHKASIRVLSYSKVFRDAELRNMSFFDKLGLLPAEVQAALASEAAAAE